MRVVLVVVVLQHRQSGKPAALVPNRNLNVT